MNILQILAKIYGLNLPVHDSKPVPVTHKKPFVNRKYSGNIRKAVRWQVYK